MSHSLRLSLLVFILLGSAYACDTWLENERLANQPPSTFLTVDEINRDGDNRLSAQIKISWWGDDPDGFLVGFEFDINGADTWKFTTRNDSVFVLPIEAGNQDANVQFRVRAVDNEGARDPSPASVVFPIRNTPPTIAFNLLELPPDTTFQLASFGWTANDIDGQENLLRYEVALNDTSSWLALDLADNFITLNRPYNSVSEDANIFLGRSYRASSLVLPNYRLNQENTIFVRVVDQAQAKSQVREYTWYAKEQRSRVLLLNDIGNPTGRAGFINQYLTSLTDLGFANVDVIHMTDGVLEANRKVVRSLALPRVTTPTLQQFVAQWDKVVWVSDHLDRNISYAAEFMGPFLANGGKVFVTIPVRFLPSDDPVWSFLPVAGLTPLPSGTTGFRIANNTPVTPLDDANTLELRTQQIMSDVAPIIGATGSKNLYRANFQRLLFPTGNAAHTGNDVIGVKSAEGNILYYGLLLHRTNGNTNFTDALNYFLVQELGF